MHLRHSLHTILLTLELAAIPLVLILSWVLNIYGAPVRSLLDTQGLRWVLVSIIPNFTLLPLAPIILALITLGVLHSSGLSECIRHPRHVRLKQRRALMFTLASIYILLALLLILIYKPNSILLNFFGGYTDSPLLDALPAFILIFLEDIACVYGYTSGRLLTLHDFIRAHSSLLSKSAPFFIHLFLLSQIVAWVGYLIHA